MDLFANLATGFATALTPANLGFCFIGALIGTLVGVLPGIAPITTIAILLPFTFSLPPASSLIMLAGIFYGAQYGGSPTAILVNVPGESSAIVTCLDGHQMAKQGRAGPALAIAAIASFVAGTVATLVIATASVPMSTLALKFNAAEYFSLMVLGLIGSVVLAHGAPDKAVAMVLVGLLLGLVGIDVNTGAPGRAIFTRPICHCRRSDSSWEVPRSARSKCTRSASRLYGARPESTPARSGRVRCGSRLRISIARSRVPPRSRSASREPKLQAMTAS